MTAYPFEKLRRFVQRGRFGLAPSDAWSFDHYLSGVIAKGVGRLRRANPETGEPNGWPGYWAMTFEEWKDTLGAIERGFRHYHEHEEWDHPDVQLAMTLFAKWFPHLWD